MPTIAAIAPSEVPRAYQVHVVDFLAAAFGNNVQGLDTIAFRLGVPQGQIGGRTVDEKAIDLVLRLCQVELTLHRLLVHLIREMGMGRAVEEFREGRLIELLYGLGRGLLDRAERDEAKRSQAREVLQLLQEQFPAFLAEHLCTDLGAQIGELEAERGWEAADETLETVQAWLPGLECLVAMRVGMAERQVRRLMAGRSWERAAEVAEGLAAKLPSSPRLKGLVSEARLPGELQRQAAAHRSADRWDEARDALARLEAGFPGYRDAADRLAVLRRWEGWYQDGIALWGRQEWSAAAAALAKVAGEEVSYKDAPARLERLRRCEALAAEGRRLLADRAQPAASQGWPRVEALYGEIEATIPGYGQAALYRRYLRALAAMHRRSWAEAEEVLESFDAEQQGFEDVAGLLATVRRLREALSGIAGAFARDPWLRWAGTYPYDALLRAERPLNPASSMKEVAAAGFDLQQGGMTREQRAAWDELRDVGRRLFVDAFLYRFEGAGEVAAWLAEEASSRFRLPDEAALAERFPQAAPYLLLLWGRREEAAALLARRQKERPDDAGAAHALGLLHLAWAEELESRREAEQARSSWRRALGQWALVLLEEGYWKAWSEERAASYGRRVSPGQIESVRAKLEGELLLRLTEQGDRSARSGSRAEAYADLQAELRAELAAIRTLQKLGGLPLAGFRRVDCGPELVEALELEEPLAQLSAQLTGRPGAIEQVLAGAPSEADARRLRQLYSSLRLAVVLLEGAQPEAGRALKLLAAADCGTCPPCGDPACALHSGLTPEVRVCCGVCPRFEARNPAYAALRGRGDWLHEDAVRLATEAHLRSARDRLGRDRDWNLQAIRTDWQDALSLGRHWEGEEEVQEAIRTAAMARAAVLGRDPASQEDASGMDRAVALLEVAAELAGEDPPLTQRLAEQLTNRGINRANRDDHAGAAHDLERAFGMAPHSYRTRDSFATALAFRAGDLAAVERAQALAMLERAQELVEVDLEASPASAATQATAELIRRVREAIEGIEPSLPQAPPFAELDALFQRSDHGGEHGEAVSSLLVEAMVKRRGEDPEGALATLSRAWEVAADDLAVQDELVGALTEQVNRLVAAGAVDEQSRLLDLWRQRFAGRPSLAARLDGLRWGPLVRRYLEDTDIKYRYGAGQTILLPFESSTVGTLMVRLSMEGESISVVVPLPPVAPEDEEAVLGSLLQAMSEVMFYRPAEGDGGALVLLARVPARWLSPAWLTFLVRGAARYADARPAVLRQTAQLRVYLRAHRQILRLLHPGGRGSLDPLRPLCRARGWPCEAVAEDRVRVLSPVGPLEAMLEEEGVRLKVDLGDLAPGAGRSQNLRRMVSHNASLPLAMLSFTDRGRLSLLCDLPDLDEASLTEVARMLEPGRDSLIRELTGREPTGR